MAIWPFKNKPVKDLSPQEMRAALIKAASGPPRKLRAVCEQYKDQVAANLDLMAKAPDGMATDSASLENHIQCLGAVAQCLANECNAPQLWDRLCGNPEDNPLAQWERWYEAVVRAADIAKEKGDAKPALELMRIGKLIKQQEADVPHVKVTLGIVLSGPLDLSNARHQVEPTVIDVEPQEPAT